MKKNFLHDLGAYGFSKIEPVILAALISEDPLLLIGKAGTGKTFLLNSLSEALGLEHRHYNASLLSFDDLVGFPMPSADGKTVDFLPTPATVWNAESVLIDELSRCRPETQNKLFSVIHERRIQGIELQRLRYRWAAMNPLNQPDKNEEDHYEGSLALDQALADRFAWIVTVPDWADLTVEEQNMVIRPSGENLINPPAQTLAATVQNLQTEFRKRIHLDDPMAVTYCRIAVGALTKSQTRISPRRARLLARNIISLQIAFEHLYGASENTEACFRLALNWSLPHRAWRSHVHAHVIDAAHAEAYRAATANDAVHQWLAEFDQSTSLERKFDMLLDPALSRDTRSLGLIRFLNRAPKTESAIFSFTAFPLLNTLDILNDEAVNLLSARAAEVIHVEGTATWRTTSSSNTAPHPDVAKYEHYLQTSIKGQNKRIKRARQLFLFMIINHINIQEPQLTEEQLDHFFRHVAGQSRQIPAVK